MSAATRSAKEAPPGAYLRFPLDRDEARHLLRALLRAGVQAVDAAEPDERALARSDAAAYDALRNRLLLLLARRELELRLDESGE